ncbi:unnamed protein product [Closterium sp. NIES-64]|nr:unnamed protein product [Closterium sp. NIES-64]
MMPPDSPRTPLAFPSQSPHTPLSLPSHFPPAPQHWQHVSGVGYADFRAFLRAQRDTWRQEREASREEEWRAAPTAPHADVAPPEADAGQKAQGKVDMGEVSMGEEVDTGKAAAAVAAALGKPEPAQVTQPATTAHVAAASSKAAAPTSDGPEEQRESGIEEEVAIRISAASGAGAAGVSSDARTDRERGDEEGGNEVASSSSAAVEEEEEEEVGVKRRDGGAGLAASAAAADVAAENQRDKKEQQGSKHKDGKQDESKHKDGKQPPSPPALPAGFTSSICSVPPEASRNVLPPPPPRPGAAGEAEGKKGARRGSEGAGSEGGAGKALERRRSAGEAVAGRGSGEVGPPVRMCAVFDDCLASVNKVQFARHHSDLLARVHGGNVSSQLNKVQFARHHPDLLAYGAADGTLRLCYVPCSRGGNKSGGAGGKRGAASVARVKHELKGHTKEVTGERGAVSVARVKHELKGHTKEVTDFDWSTDDDYLCSSSADKSVRVWDVGSGQCLRIIYTVIPQTCIIFHPDGRGMNVSVLSCMNVAVLSCMNVAVLSCMNVAVLSCMNVAVLSCMNVAVLSCMNVSVLSCMNVSVLSCMNVSVLSCMNQNNNFLVVANSKRELTVMNFSTGRVVSRVAMDSNVTALVADRTTIASSAAAGSATTSGSSGGGGGGGATSKAGAAAAAGSGGFGGGAGEADSVVFVGDSEGAIHSFTVDKQSGALLRRHKTVAGVVHPAPVASLHYSPTSVLANGPVLLACSKDGCVRFYTTALELNGYLFLKISLQLSSRATNMNAAFCPPLGPSGSGEYIVTGNADHHVYFYDFMKPRSPLVARIPGHKAMVVDVSWNNSNTVLASCDCDGVVALWQRV